MNVVEWAAGVNGRRVTAPGGLGGQCVDLANVYLLARGWPPVRRNAVGWSRSGVADGWVWEANRPLNHPSAGDIVVWRGGVPARGIGPDGHVAVCMAADRAAIISLDQNWAQSTVVAIEWHDYVGVVGWWRPGAAT